MYTTYLDRTWRLLCSFTIILSIVLLSYPTNALAVHPHVDLVIDESNIDSTLVDFPVYVNLADMPSSFWSDVSSDGGDIRVFTDWNIEVPYELSSFNKASTTGSLFFKAPSISATEDTGFEIHYGDSSKTAYSATSTYGKNNVWKSAYKAVLHFEENPSGTLYDSTSEGNNATSSGTMDSSNISSGKLTGSALTLNGTDEVIGIAHDTSIDWDYDDSFGVYAWVKTDNFEGIGSKFLGQKGWLCKGTIINGTTFDSQYVQLRNSATYEIRKLPVNDQNLDDNQWHLIHCTYNGNGFASGIDMYKNGTKVASTTLHAGEDELESHTFSNTGRFRIGDHENFYQGTFDELRLVEEDLSDAWIKAEYANMSSSTSFYSICDCDCN